LIDLNGTQAAIRAGYSKRSARQIADENLAKPDIVEYLNARRTALQDKLEITQEWVIRRLKEVSDRCMQAVPVMKFDPVNKCMVQATDEFGNDIWQFDSAGANRSTELIGKHLGMFITSKIELPVNPLQEKRPSIKLPDGTFIEM
jgi:phage terminase small subunit